MTTIIDHLHRLYAQSDDPWEFDKSPYEQEKFTATAQALTRHHYHAALEIGCGNGALARHLAPRCGRYVGIDAVERAVASARHRVPEAEFHLGCYPCPLPGDGFDLVILSEILYFLTPENITRLCDDIARSAPHAEIICTTFLGDTEQALQGGDALALFRKGMKAHLTLENVKNTGRYRIDRGSMGKFR